ncbi:Zinc finger protein 436 [Plakobranchus ocellatus]|uniref:Zinc finger protein 436 n=1 Tax=Plakobranchus ocellatus TaxID=259542 RepID=A0AAV3YYR7_9GAST|nr:Zinc finger protein 436 [Plakobranchus ocellatus]
MNYSTPLSSMTEDDSELISHMSKALAAHGCARQDIKQEPEDDCHFPVIKCKVTDTDEDGVLHNGIKAEQLDSPQSSEMDEEITVHFQDDQGDYDKGVEPDNLSNGNQSSAENQHVSSRCHVKETESQHGNNTEGLVQKNLVPGGGESSETVGTTTSGLHESLWNQIPGKPDVCRETQSGERLHVDFSNYWTVREDDPDCRSLKHPTKQLYTCDVCSITFLSINTLNSHRQKHSGRAFYKCDLCRKTFVFSSDLDAHKSKHSASKLLICDLCNKCFLLKDTLLKHMRRHLQDRIFKCDECGKRFRHQRDFRIHGRRHAGEKLYECSVCGKRYFRLDTLNVHQLTHLSSKPYVCDICHKGFTYSANLHEHKKVHSGEKRHTCNVCSRSFARKQTLKRHKATHLETKAFECNLCNKTFRRKENLTMHERRHTGVKPFPCDACDKKFTRSDTLKNHKKRHLANLATKV